MSTARLSAPLAPHNKAQLHPHTVLVLVDPTNRSTQPQVGGRGLGDEAGKRLAPRPWSRGDRSRPARDSGEGSEASCPTRWVCLVGHTLARPPPSSRGRRNNSALALLLPLKRAWTAKSLIVHDLGRGRQATTDRWALESFRKVRNIGHGARHSHEMGDRPQWTFDWCVQPARCTPGSSRSWNPSPPTGSTRPTRLHLADRGAGRNLNPAGLSRRSGDNRPWTYRKRPT
jgi:hypothetical protein